MAQERKNGSAVAHGSNGATFEQQFSRLQEVVQKLSGGNLTLQDALAAFEEGMALADSCGAMLEEAELRVQQVSEHALRAGQASVLDIDTAMRALPTEADAEILTFESYESTLVFEVPEARQPAAQSTQPEKKNTPARAIRPITQNPSPITSDPKPIAQNPSPNPPLDPLFDEDD